MTWRARAACRGMDTDLFFPDRGDMDAIAQARKTCRNCPVSTECLWAAVELIEPYGIYSGTTVSQRRAIRRAYGIDSYRATEAQHGTEARYRHHGCRCEPCLQAHRYESAKRIERQPRSAA